jgi:hypothetical protein
MRCLALALFLLAGPALAQGDPEFTPRRMRGWNPAAAEGRCILRVVVDDESDVLLRGDRVRLRTISGAPGRDDGSECTQPLPGGEVYNFRFRGIDGRGEVRLTQEPQASNGWVAVVNIRDRKGGSEGYTFELSWRSGAGATGVRGGGGGRWARQEEAAPFENLSMNGRGRFTAGGQSDEIESGYVGYPREGVRIELRRRNARTVVLTGRLRQRRGDLVYVDLESSAEGRVRGEALIRYERGGLAQISGDGATERGAAFQFDLRR